MSAERQSGPETLGDLFEGFFFEVPRYQRYYSWSTEQLEDLWTDLQTLPAGKDHYFGTVILQETPEDDNEAPPGRPMAEEQEKHLIIDGQQRLTTISILFKVMLNELEAIADELEQSDQWRESLAEIESKWLVDEGLYRLRLQEGDHDFFQQYVIEDKEYIEPDTPSERSLATAKEFFQEEFATLKESKSPETFAKDCRMIRKQVSDLEMMIHYVGADNDEQATRIFESENDRGKKLSKLERTKSFLMHMAYRSAEEGDGSFERTIETVRASFAQIYRHMQSIEDAERDDPSEDGIQQYHYISYADWSNKKEYQGEAMLDNLKRQARTLHAEDRSACLNAIEEYTNSLEQAFKHIKNILTYTADDAVHTRLRRIYTLGNVANFYPLLIPIWDGYEERPDELEDALKMIETAIIRLYAIGGHPSYAKRPSLHVLARENNAETSIAAWKEEISSIVGDWESDESFRRLLKSQDFYSDQQSKQIRYLLYFYEKRLCEEEGEPDVPDFDTVMGSGYEVEHIWPQSPETYPIPQEDYEALKHRLGNLTIVSDEYNKEDLRNKLFEEKCPEFAKSSYRLNREKIGSEDRWGEGEISAREDEDLVPFILAEWPLAR